MTPPIQWFPGHMKKAQNLIMEYRDQVDVILEVLDARAPLASRNPLIQDLVGGKPRVVVLTKTDLADPEVTSRWKDWFDAQDGLRAVMVSSRDRKNLQAIPQAATLLCRGKKWFGMRKIRGLIVGIPNSGKSTLINALAGGRKASVADKPGHTKSVQRIQAGENFYLLDTPGILWHKFEDPEVGIKLALLGSVKDEVLDLYHLSLEALKFLQAHYPGALVRRYSVEAGEDPETLLHSLARSRGFLRSGGELDLERGAKALLTDFRSGLLGRISLERPLPP